jgi:hypothetical protein
MKAYKKLVMETDGKKKIKQHLKIVFKCGKWRDDDGILLYWQRLV